MSPRKTRRGTKSINETMSEAISKTMEEDTPVEIQRIRRTRRRVTKTSSLESDADHSFETNKSTKKIVQQTPLGKTPRTRRKAALETTVNESYSETQIKTRRTRRGKENESVTEQKTLLDNTNTEDSIVGKSRGTRARKKVVKKMNSKSDDESTEVVINEKTNANAAKNVTIMEEGTNGDDAIPMSIEDAEVHRVSDTISRLKAAAVLPGKRRRNTKLPIDECTPESSPITVNLTPHRTTKTPRKSPMNLDSPKSHGETSLRLSKTPRKLPIVAESPVPSEKSFTSSIEGTPIKSPKINTSDTTKTGRSPKSSKNKLVPVRKFSKSPKIVLRSPKQKSSKSKSPRVVASKVKKISLSKSSIKSPVRSNKSSNANLSTSPGKKSLSPKNIRESSKQKKSPGTRMSINLSGIDSPTSDAQSPNISTKPNTRSEQLVNSPTVHLNKLPNDCINTPETVTITRSRKNTPSDDSTRSTPTKSQSAEKRSSQGGESPRRPKSVGKKRGPITDSGTPLRPIDTPTGSAIKQSAGKSIILSSSSTPAVDIARRKFNSGLLIHSSTPRERIRRSLNLSPGLETPTLSKIDINSSINRPTPVGSSTMINESRGKRRSMRIEDESNPLIVSQDENSSSSETRLNGTYEVEATVLTEKEDEKPANGTYELAEPKTPNLRRKAAKRSLGEMDTSNDERAAKRTCRVRFASPQADDNENKTVATVIGKSRSATPAHPTGVIRFNAGTKVSASETITSDKIRRRSNSMSNTALTRTPLSKKRSNSVTDGNAGTASKKAQNASVNRLSKPRFSINLSAKKQEVKTPIARKAPNFAEIHQRKFAKMESLVDAKKRLEKRHIAAMTTSQIPTSLAKTPNDTAKSKPTVSAKPTTPRTAVNGAYNRYGFKLRKNDAVKIMTQKQPPIKSDKKQNENRMLLKGVRTNRRFDLIMKARNINL